MKVVSKEEENAHYNSVIQGGLIGGSLGLGVGLGGVMLASRRYPAFRSLTLPFRAFLVTSAGTFGAIVNAERHSAAFHRANDPMNFYVDETTRALELARQQESTAERLRAWGQANRYPIVFASWVASMALALGIVGRSRLLTTSQKLVQARVYAQGLTLAVLIATAALETADARSGSGRWETVKVLDPDDPEHKHLVEKRVHKEDYQGQDLWKDMVAAEERRLAQKKKDEEAEAQAQAAKPSR
ncbi:hypothetical protein F4779DRAFT_371403 [Xylariaceae sp. FL0662B]|nr:hypothetical protein F4779DRAFT_371403 [Xylariaceae sp. FL0662B]